MIRVAIIGLRAVTQNIHLPAYSRIRDKVRVVGGSDIDAVARISVGRKRHLPEVYDMPNFRPETNSEVVNIISLEFADGRGASMILDRLSKGPERYLEMRLDGEFESIHTSIGGEVRCEIGMHTRERRPFLSFDFVKGGKAVLQNGNRSEIIAKDGINPFASATAVHFRKFVEAIQNGGEPPGTARDNRNTLALAFAAIDSAQSGKAIEIGDYLKKPSAGVQH